MGNKTLTILLFASVVALAESKYPQIDQLIEKVKTKRVGLKPEEIKKLKNPFINEKKLVKLEHKIIHKKLSKRRVVFHLSSIFGDRARINGRWYKIGSKVGAYRLRNIGTNYVVLARGKKVLRLYMHQRKRKLIKIWSR